MKWSRLGPVMFIGIVLLGSLGAPLARAQVSTIFQPDVPGSVLVFPIFDVIGGNQTKIRITNNGVSAVSIHLNYICQPLGTSSFCPLFDESQPLTPHQTLVLDVGTQLAGACPTGQGYIVAIAEAQCPPATPLPGCPRWNGTVVEPGEFAPLSFNQLFGSYSLFYNGFANAPTILCGGVPCSPPPTGPVPDVEAAAAIAIQSPQQLFSFLGVPLGGGVTSLLGAQSFGDLVAIPGGVATDFAAPGAALLAGPAPVPPFIQADTASGTELQTNLILLNLHYTQFDANATAEMRVQAWNWFEVSFTSTHRFVCWERLPIDLIDARLTAARTFGATYGNIRLQRVSGQPLPPGLEESALLGVREEVSTGGRTLTPTGNPTTIAPEVILPFRFPIPCVVEAYDECRGQCTSKCISLHKGGDRINLINAIDRCVMKACTPDKACQAPVVCGS